LNSAADFSVKNIPPLIRLALMLADLRIKKDKFSHWCYLLPIFISISLDRDFLVLHPMQELYRIEQG
jgi:hypothetical protein